MAVLVATLGLACTGSGSDGSGGAESSTSAPAGEHARSLDQAVLTPEGTDDYRLRTRAGGVRVSAPPTNQGENLRMVFWRRGSARQRDAESCATWQSERGEFVQQGAALRIVETPDGAVRAVTVSRDVFRNAPPADDRWWFNFHVWDSRDTPAFHLLGQVELPRLRRGDHAVPLPWYFCARTKGRTLAFKVWRPDEEEPEYGDPASSGSVEIPEGWVVPGYTGLYAAHLWAGDEALFTDLVTR